LVGEAVGENGGQIASVGKKRAARSIDWGD
jgi:hypothetical protein